MSKQQKFWIALGVLLFICVVAWAIRTAPQPPAPQPVEQQSTTMTYDDNTLKEEKNGRKIWELSSETMTVDTDTKNVELTNLSGKFYDEEGREVSLTADHGTYENETKNIVIDSNVKVQTSDGAVLTCDKLIWTDSESKLTADGNAYIKHEDMEARADKIESTNAFHHFKATGKAHIVKGAK
ncbi:MAG: LPS export ABC transporter periplasmic protein LptC [Selenomonadaceae bacterium]|nr:LPS export ABC transporter periplasmic protein LptC [Selenomonadaceae bacterium]